MCLKGFKTASLHAKKWLVENGMYLTLFDDEFITKAHDATLREEGVKVGLK